MFKGILFCCIVLVVSAILSVTANATILFENRTQQRLSRGVTYERNRMMTANGMLDVHVLLVDLNAPYLYIEPITTSQNLGRRDTTLNMLSDAGAIAGINADFFGMAGAYSVHFGTMAREGEVVALNVATNYHRNEFATFFLDLQNNANFVYMQTDIRFYNNGVRNVTDINAFNNIGHELYWPVIVDRQVMENTIALDNRFDWLSKVVVENDVITFVSMPGETVDVPENGYVLILPERMHSTHRHLFRMGDSAQLVFTNNLNVDFSRIQAAIGGGSLILYRGETVNDGAAIAPNARHPRTAIGVDHVNRRLILMAADGRSHSIGATHAEMADILRRYGATDAMHMDGGGSTTLVTRRNDGRYSVANTPSDGGQRRVINALGVFDRAPIGSQIEFVLEMQENRAVVGVPVIGRAFMEDNFFNRLALDPMVETVFFVEDNEGGFWQDGRFTPLRAGRHNIEVWHGDSRATASIYAYSLAELQIRPESLSLLEGDRAELRFLGVAEDGSPVPVPAVTGLTVSPAYLGVFDGEAFVATRAGAGYISARVGAIRAYIPVSVGGFPLPLDMYNGQRFLGYPAYVVGNARVENMEGRRVNRLEYMFVVSGSTQAANMVFEPALEMPGEPIALRLQVFGDGSGHWLRGRVQDGDGNNHLIDFSHSVDFEGWGTVTARLPANAVGPFTIDRIYMVTLGSHDVSLHTVLFYGLEALYAPPSAAVIPQGTVFHDRKRADTGFAGVAGGGSYQFTVPTAETRINYSSMAHSDFAAITMTARGGGINAADRNQWSQFMRDVRNINPKYVVILIDENPFNFRQRMEFELFHGAMEELLDEGRLVFVVSATGPTGQPATLTMRDGVRYIDIARPTEGVATIRFWTDTDEDMLWWSE